MSDLPDRTPHQPSEEDPYGSSPSRAGDEPTEVHRTADPGRQDSSVTAFTPAPPSREPIAAPGAEPAAASAAAAVPRKVSVRNRGRMRRRLRYLRRVRELGYRDLGGLVFELRRAGVDNEVLVGAKVDALSSIDQELRVLEHGLRDYLNVEELMEPGVSVCLRCGALHGSDANFCPQCGIRVDQQPASHMPSDPATVASGPPTGTHQTTGAPTGSFPGRAGSTGSYPGQGGSTTGTGSRRR